MSSNLTGASRGGIVKRVKAPVCNTGGVGSTPTTTFKYSRSSAEEQLGDIEKVGGSIPLVSTNICPVSIMDKCAALRRREMWVRVPCGVLKDGSAIYKRIIISLLMRFNGSNPCFPVL